MSRTPGSDSAGRVFVNASATRMRLVLSDQSELIVDAWRLVRVADAGVSIVRAEPMPSSSGGTA